MGNRFRVGDDVIAHIARILQLSLLTGTDIVDHLRAIRLVEMSQCLLGLDPEYKRLADDYEKKLVEEISEKQDVSTPVEDE